MRIPNNTNVFIIPSLNTSVMEPPAKNRKKKSVMADNIILKFISLNFNN